MVERLAFKTGRPIHLRDKPHLFRQGGCWRAWISVNMQWPHVQAAHDHLKKLAENTCPKCWGTFGPAFGPNRATCVCGD